MIWLIDLLERARRRQDVLRVVGRIVDRSIVPRAGGANIGDSASGAARSVGGQTQHTLFAGTNGTGHGTCLRIGSGGDVREVGDAQIGGPAQAGFRQARLGKRIRQCRCMGGEQLGDQRLVLSSMTRRQKRERHVRPGPSSNSRLPRRDWQ